MRQVPNPSIVWYRFPASTTTSAVHPRVADPATTQTASELFRNSRRSMSALLLLQRCPISPFGSACAKSCILKNGRSLTQGGFLLGVAGMACRSVEQERCSCHVNNRKVGRNELQETKG